MRQLMLASIMYSGENKQGIYIFRYPGWDDNLEPLFIQGFCKDYNITICPSTQNVVTRTEHLRDNDPGGPAASNGGHSYEVRHLWPDYTFPDGFICHNERMRFSDGMLHDVEPMKQMKRFKQAAKVCLLMDADDQWGGKSRNNWPDPGDNHGAAGINVSYLDGHVEWTPTGRPLLQAFMDGYYVPNADYPLPGGPSVYQKYGLVQSGNKFTWAW